MKKGKCQAPLQALPRSSNKTPHLIFLYWELGPPSLRTCVHSSAPLGLSRIPQWFFRPLHPGDPQRPHSSQPSCHLRPPRHTHTHPSSFLSLCASLSTYRCRLLPLPLGGSPVSLVPSFCAAALWDPQFCPVPMSGPDPAAVHSRVGAATGKLQKPLSRASFQPSAERTLSLSEGERLSRRHHPTSPASSTHHTSQVGHSASEQTPLNTQRPFCMFNRLGR